MRPITFCLRILLVSVMAAALTPPAAAQDSLGTFRTDPVAHFLSQAGDTWVGNGTFLMYEYSDTIQISPVDDGSGLALRRVLVNAEKGQAVSSGGGTIKPLAGDSTYAVQWSERRYSDLSGTMRWNGEEGEWVVSFAGEWSAWTVHIRYDSPSSFVAAVARSMGGFPSVELAAMIYRRVGSTK